MDQHATHQRLTGSNSARRLSALSALFLTLGLFAAQIPVPLARSAAEHFMAGPQLGRLDVSLTLAHTATVTTAQGELATYHVFNATDGGYVIVAGDDLVQPVLAYAPESNFDPADLPTNVAKWLEGYSSGIQLALAANTPQADAVRRQWEELLGGALSTSGMPRAVAPLMQTTWNQAPHYNAQCPGGSVTGCVATAMAQIMKFWNHPATGSGFHQFNHPQYGTLAANFGGTTYAWGSMPNNVSSANSAVATLMYHCGVGVDMQYSPEVSGAWVIQSHSPSTDHNAEYALRTYFGYRSTLSGVARENYAQAQWIDLLRTELDAGRPILYDGFGDGGGHAFVCDGYDDNNFFHFNWGWGGAHNGYFTVNALNPPGTGIGGGSGGYNAGQEVIIGIQPPATSVTYGMALYDYVSPSASTLGYGQAFDVYTNIVNNGTGTFNGDYCAAVFDAAGNFVDYVEVLSGFTLQSNYMYTDGLTFSSTGMYGMLPGTYSVGIYYRPTGGNWVQVANSGSYTNYAQITVVNYNTIALNSSMTVTPSGDLTQGGSVSVNLNIVNDGGSTFVGEYDVSLYNLDGSFAQTIGTYTESNGLPSGYTYLAPYLTFGLATVTVPPGTYLVAALHDPGSGWELTGTGSFSNPITVTVVAPATQPDSYEVNNSVAQAYALPVNFSGNTASVSTQGSNLHVTNDLDHYKLVLAGGYDYTVNARLHDSYNSGNGNTYTADGLFTWSTDGNTWSSTFDDVMADAITVQNGGTVHFRVAPYFAGEVGTYLLQLNLTRTALVGVEEQHGASALAIYPNPTSDRFRVERGVGSGRLNGLVLLDMQGASVKELTVAGSAEFIDVDVSDLAVGTYVLQATMDQGIRNQRLIIAR
ncbi:MAG: thiol protease/hemagglutinin PrtT [Flavobacteriales bacterium]|jgi:hypothetical protein|nr:thiol protease/hemagglutinin PrtT [Flavobacteriales bacterium]MBK7620830.1 thiol protease/hemagglutinin PrtT [Flavobacteriales bacterium]MBK8708706.1 thiol protease/hemagglutinin PrtT [Flavobacteriales bacterium]HQV40200.1 C10 family peptidase [Flavobacteriales bacterium]